MFSMLQGETYGSGISKSWQAALHQREYSTLVLLGQYSQMNRFFLGVVEPV
jgi:hypothetical protein